MPLLDILRVVNVLIWTLLLLYMIPGAKNAIWGTDTRRGDPMRLGVAFVCLVMIGGNLRWLFAPDDRSMWVALYVMSAAVGLYIAKLAKAYGRGPLV